MDDKEIVSAVLTELAGKVGIERCEWWFGGVRLEHVGETLRVTAADEFTLEQLRRRFHHELAEVARRQLGPATRVEYRPEHRTSPREAAGAEEQGAIRPAKDSANGESAPAVAETENSAAELPGRNGRPDDGAHLLQFAPAAAATPPARGRVTLESFVASEANRLAITAAQRVLREPGVFSPLFLHGPSGVGKSHLLRGIAAAARRGRLRTVYLTAEQFTTSFVEAVRGSGLPSFRHKCRGVDLLLIDDVQFFEGKRATIVELQHTIDDLLRRGMQLVLAGDRPPTELGFWGADLVTRINAGLVCSLAPPDLPTRRELARAAADRASCSIPEAVVQLLAERLSGDVRLLHGAINRIELAQEAFGLEVTTERVEQWLADFWPRARRAISLPEIRQAVSEVFGLEEEALQQAGRTRRDSQPRMLAMWLARKYTRAALSEIGRYFGGRTHTTVLSAQKRVGEWIEEGTVIDAPALHCPASEAVRRIEARLNAG